MGGMIRATSKTVSNILSICTVSLYREHHYFLTTVRRLFSLPSSSERPNATDFIASGDPS